jgi:hypothetical protein
MPTVRSGPLGREQAGPTMIFETLERSLDNLERDTAPRVLASKARQSVRSGSGPGRAGTLLTRFGDIWNGRVCRAETGTI